MLFTWLYRASKVAGVRYAEYRCNSILLQNPAKDKRAVLD